MIRKLLVTFGIVSTLLLPVAYAPATSAALFDGSAGDACEGVGLGGSGCASSSKRISITMKRIVNFLSVIVGIAAVIMVLIAGFKYVTSNGDASNVKSAKDTLIYALVGLAVAALAQFLVQFVLVRIL